MARFNQLDKRTQEVFNRIVIKEIPELTKDDIGFLKARIAYLSKKQLEYFGPVLNSNKQVEELVVEEVPDTEVEPFK
jgi:hypothetical protein